jgi:hypothetical protein
MEWFTPIPWLVTERSTPWYGKLAGLHHSIGKYREWKYLEWIMKLVNHPTENWTWYKHIQIPTPTYKHKHTPKPNASTTTKNKTKMPNGSLKIAASLHCRECADDRCEKHPTVEDGDLNMTSGYFMYVCFAWVYMHLGGNMLFIWLIRLLHDVVATLSRICTLSSVSILNRHCRRWAKFDLYRLHGLTVFECLSVLNEYCRSWRHSAIGTEIDREYLRGVENKMAWFADECGDYVFFCTQGCTTPPRKQYPVPNDSNHKEYTYTKR